MLRHATQRISEPGGFAEGAQVWYGSWVVGRVFQRAGEIEAAIDTMAGGSREAAIKAEEMRQMTLCTLWRFGGRWHRR